MEKARQFQSLHWLCLPCESFLYCLYSKSNDFCSIVFVFIVSLICSAFHELSYHPDNLCSVFTNFGQITHFTMLFVFSTFYQIIIDAKRIETLICGFLLQHFSVDCIIAIVLFVNVQINVYCYALAVEISYPIYL